MNFFHEFFLPKAAFDSVPGDSQDCSGRSVHVVFSGLAGYFLASMLANLDDGDGDLPGTVTCR
jgi:hypothetical protein